MNPTEGAGPGCACVSDEALTCAMRRYGLIAGEEDHDDFNDGERCECSCHERPDGDDEPRGRWPWVTDADVED